MRRVLPAALIASVVLAAGAGAQQPDQHVPDPRITDGSAKRALDGAKRTWTRAAIASYRYRLRVGCFCPPESRGPVTITVRGRKPVRPPEGFADAATVPRLHRIVRRAIEDGAAQLDVRYDARGVPLQISVDSRRQLADEEQALTVDRFKRLPRRR